MAYIKEITYCFETSIKVGDFQYEKPKICMVSCLENGDSQNEVFAELKSMVHERIEAIKYEHERY